MPPKLAPLPQSTAHLLTASHTITTFESAIEAVVQNSVQHAATTVLVTIRPLALRFTVLDNGRIMHRATFDALLLRPTPSATAVAAQGLSLAALAATSAVELRVRNPHVIAMKTVRAAHCLDHTIAPPSGAHAILPRTGVQVDVWELFVALPVRRRIEHMRCSDELQRAVRHRLVALALANPAVALTVRVGSDSVLLRTLPTPRLCVAQIEAAFGPSHGLSLCLVDAAVAAAPFHLHGFVDRLGLLHARVQLLAIDGRPYTLDGLHRAVKRAFRLYQIRFPPVNSTARRYPAYVLNFSTVASSALRRRHAHHHGRPSLVLSDASLCASSASLQTAVTNVVLNALSEMHSPPLPEKRQVPNRNASASASDAIQIASRKRERFADARIVSEAITKKRPRSAWSSDGSSANASTIRPLSEGANRLPRPVSGCYVNNDSIARVAVARRAVSAHDVESVFRRHAGPQWTNPCFEARGRPSRAVVSASGSRAAYTRAGNSAHCEFDQMKVNISREAFGTMRIIGQIDKKFIIVVDGQHNTKGENGDEGMTMYAIDQHAASERALYERYLKHATVGRVKSFTLARAKRVKVTYSQRRSAEENQAILSKWSWTIELPGDEDDIVQMVRVPQLKCGRLGTIVVGDSQQLCNYLDSFLNGAARGNIPKPMVEAVASAACHSAVRFGDVLCKAQCEAVVRSLEICDNPFACAHGRPSIVPLLILKHNGNYRS